MLDELGQINILALLIRVGITKAEAIALTVATMRKMGIKLPPSRFAIDKQIGRWYSAFDNYMSHPCPGHPSPTAALNRRALERAKSLWIAWNESGLWKRAVRNVNLSFSAMQSVLAELQRATGDS